MKLSDIKEEFSKYIILKDEHAIEMIVASVIGNLLIDRDPLWIFIVAPSSGGKSTLVAPIGGIPSVHFIDDLTEKTFLSGYKMKGKEMSLLKMIGSGIIAFSDFTSILAKNSMSRNEILGQMRLVYDGIFTKQTGTGKIEWKGKIGVLAACTPDIYLLLEDVRSAGERFIFYWLEQPSDEEIYAKQQEVKISSREITEKMKGMYAEYFTDIQAWAKKYGNPEFRVSDEQRMLLRQAAIFCVNGKTVVHTDFKSGLADSIPNKAGVGRDAKMFDTLLQTLQLMNCYEKDDPTIPVQDWMIDIVEKCSYSSVNRERRKILEILADTEQQLTASEIGAREGLGLEKESVEKYLIPLHSVGLIKKNASTAKFRWYIDNDDIKFFIKRVSARLVETVVPPAIEQSGEGDLLEEYNREHTV